MAFWRTGFILRNPFSQEKNRGHFMALLHYSDDAKPAGWFYQKETNKDIVQRI